MINRVGHRHRYRSIFFSKRARSAIKTITVQNVVHFPQEITLEGDHRRRTLSSVASIYSKIKSKRITLDFSKTKKIDSQGMIVIYAALRNARNIQPDIEIRCSKISNNKIRQVLKQIGVYALCFQRCSVETTRDDVINWRVCCGVDVISQKFDTIVNPDTELQQLPPEIDLYGGCIEATKNVGRHAYIDDDGELQSLHRNNGLFDVAYKTTAWWCFSQVKDNKLSVVVCDLGLSIPYTLPNKRPKLFHKLQTLIKGNSASDAELIKSAIETPSSRSGEDYRGNGLPRIAEIASISGGSMAIYSRNGGLFITPTGQMITSSYRAPLYGTVIAWTLPLGGEQ